MGRRYGGDKQLASLGPSGELLSDYTLYDAHRAGIIRAVFVARADLESALRAHHLPWRHRLDIRYVIQQQPRGTVDAVLTARPEVSGSFVVVNADDYYGPAAIGAARSALAAGRGLGSPPVAIAVSFRLGETLTPRGSVSRARLDVDGSGWLESITEIAEIDADSGLPPDQPISMNCWGLPFEAFPLLQDALSRFQAGEGISKWEYALPVAIGALIRESRIRVQVIPAGTGWIGLTYADDMPDAARALRRLVEAGSYPTPLAG